MRCKPDHFRWADGHCFHDDCPNFYDRCPRHGYKYRLLRGAVMTESAMYAVDGDPFKPCMGVK